MTNAKVTKVVGAPGSGKTTKLLNLLREELQAGENLGKRLFCTFTRAAREEVEDRLVDIADAEGLLEPDRGEDEEEVEGRVRERVRTLHSAALAACREQGVIKLRNRNNLDDHGKLIIRRTNDRDSPYFEWFFKEHFPYIEYDPDGDDPITGLQNGEWDTNGGVPAGNQVMALYDYLRSEAWRLDQFHFAEISEGIELPDPEIHDVLCEWEAFKARNDLIQDDDYVHKAVVEGCPPPGDVRVLFIDEFQDLSPIQILLFEMWRDSGTVDHIYVAGDPHQAIYGFRGADPAYFNGTDADKTIREETSRRCPQAVIDAAKPIADLVPEHDVGRVTAHTPGGHVEHIGAKNPDALSTLVRQCVDEHGEVFLLARTNRQAGKIAYGLREHGLPYLDVSPSGDLNDWQHPLNTLLIGARAFDAEQPLPVPTVARLLYHSRTTPEREALQNRITVDHNNHRRFTEGDSDAVATAAGVRSGDLIPYSVYRRWFPDANDGRELTDQLVFDREWEQELFAGAIEGRATHDPEDVRVGTIHAAKGLEVPCVLVFPAYSHNQLERYHVDQGTEAEERRLFYVAMTRAKHTALVVHDYFGGEEFPPLAWSGV